MRRTGIVLATMVLTLGLAGGASPQLSDALNPARASRVAVQLAGPVQPARVAVPFVVHAEVTPVSGIHVYAPGNRDYIPVNLSLDWPADVRVKEPQYPSGEPYIFGPLKELVMVYQRPFKITQQATILPGTPAARARSIDVSGTLRYQACDDRMCFPVQSVPVRTRIAVERARGRAR